MKAFILVFSYVALDRQKMLDYLDTIPLIVRNWRATEFAVFVVSDMPSTAILANAIATKFPNLRFFLGEIKGIETQGRLDEQSWNFINFPVPIR